MLIVTLSAHALGKTFNVAGQEANSFLRQPPADLCTTKLSSQCDADEVRPRALTNSSRDCGPTDGSPINPEAVFRFSMSQSKRETSA
ncbi:hypothetical protein EVAR_14595_1 [Eumeta japonica]|uniref:Uncharacterized protein n=1 Tax=Eumeta variegata TaxID=151549 RepID=A0A4C1UVN4_EUMVA|nr:hypothetical protein EVAR_14595_1 [Eumeta japonica]